MKANYYIAQKIDTKTKNYNKLVQMGDADRDGFWFNCMAILSSTIISVTILLATIKIIHMF